MDTLLNIFRGLKNYSYYPGVEEKESAKEFIQGYFCQGDKDCIANFLDEVSVDDMRYEHMKSTYMLGAWLYDSCSILRVAINHEFRNLDEGEKRQEFLYRWYLTSLFHDVGYCYENKVFEPKFETYLYSKLKHFSDKVEKCECMIPEDYKESILKYYQFRKEKSLVDHGVAGAVLLHDILKPVHSYPHEYNNLKWGPDIFKKDILPCTLYILAHNIWTASENTDRASEYKEKGLSSLIQPIGRFFIHFEKHPMLFLLCFVDTIEPIKLLQKKDNLTTKQCLESVTMDVESNNIHISFDRIPCSGSCLGWNFNDYYLSAIVKNLNFLVCGSFKIATGNDEIVCHLQTSRKSNSHNVRDEGIEPSINNRKV